MTDNPPPEDHGRGPAPPPMGDNPADDDRRDPHPESAQAAEETSGVRPGPDDESVVAEESIWGSGDPGLPPDPADEEAQVAEGGDHGDKEAEPPAPPFEEVSLFVPPARRNADSSESARSSREMGWKMMAVAGVLLLAGGFAAGIFFPEWSTPAPESTTTTAATIPAAESSTPSPTAPPVTTPSTTAATATPTTTAPTPAPVEEAPPVEPPPLVATDEPVSDVANRLVPSVVHLEIQSDDLFEQGAGSGVIFDSRGYIFTAAHVVSTVVEGDADLTVRLSTGDRLPGEVLGTDPDSDVAVIKVDRTGLTPAELALDDWPRVGQLVVAVGSPWGLESSVTSGVISAVDRMVEGRLLIQSDAVLYPGNSGGALADRYGRLIGINVSIFTDSTTLDSIEFQGVGFAVPIDIAYRVAQALMEGRPVQTAFLGISGQDTQGDAGVEVMEVFPGSGAEQAGLRAGDVVVGVGGRPVTGIADLAARIRHLSPGDLIVLDVLRGEDRLSLAARLLPRSEVMSNQEEPAEGSTEE